MVIINRVEDTEYFLSARGCDTLLFRTSPNCFLLLINNIYLLSISTNQLISKRLGFPYYDQKFYEEENNKFTVVMKKGNEGMMLPLIRKSFILKGVELYQPMFPQRAFGNYINYYESDYVKKRSLDWENGIGRIFVNKNRIIRFYDNEFDWLPKISSNKWDLRLTASKQVFQTQIDLVSTLPSMDRLSGKRKAEINYVHKLGIQSNKRILEIIDNKLW